MSELRLFVISDNVSSERRVNTQWTIGQLKEKLEVIVGIPPSSQRLVYEPLLGGREYTFSSADDNKTVGDFGLEELATLNVHDTRPVSVRDNFNDLSQVEKYEMSNEEYEKRTDSVLMWKKQNKLGRFNPEAEKLCESRRVELERELSDVQQNVGKRCSVPGDRLGTVRYVGFVPEINETSLWAGVEFDEPVGKNDGSVKGKRYFTCAPKHGSFVPLKEVTIGEFPAFDILSQLED
ncbi:tubulin specific chaperone cofactor B [Schizosaccharomyces japonicus yFS275]|uniref:Tubulin specific chaperone cofactor B n=1 Tax=Schizosaccharomyces japonicus (strain yFS275 / FY16936) TaxID=402676 RepID=B6JZK0_SCHJY|nr:tubulin specific chaperone cofactor B [Schizosaccharomyces japonicus yFS275]EEB06968.1 tubulin specific chaperone cofactor B [Schizosaccharomyces japonicus yFS275]